MGKKYSNTYSKTDVHSFKELFKWMRSRPKKMNDFQVPQHEHKMQSFLRENREEQTITWIGHSTFLIQQGGLNILTDPVWATKMGVSKRLTDPGLKINELPPIDVILISHSHYDHLHFQSIKKIIGNPRILVPEGLSELFKRKGYTEVDEFPWWGKHRINDVEFHFVPAQHWTRRSLWDTNRTLWGGWVIQSMNGDTAGESTYFTGDSGYFQVFKEIGGRFKINTALLPIGAYEPEWFMSISHVTPEEAVQAFVDLGAYKFIPMHYGTFKLADDIPKEALERLLNEWEKRELNNDQLFILELGQTFIDSNIDPDHSTLEDERNYEESQNVETHNEETHNEELQVTSK